MRWLAATLATAAACGGGNSVPDARPRADARADAASGPDAPADAPPPDARPDANPLRYVHTITIDGRVDFDAADHFLTTSAGFDFFVSWDDTNVYFGWLAPDIDPTGPDANTKWAFAYLDVDPGAGTGEVDSQTYNTQHVSFPTGFGAEYYLRWKCDATLTTIEVSDGAGGWSQLATTPQFSNLGSYVEMAVPRTLIGDPAALGIASWMINEKPGVEGTFAGIYEDNFVDGYHADLSLTAYLRADFAAAEGPNDPLNRRP
jgi:hypothetical protein